jgi:hypothetical protein
MKCDRRPLLKRVSVLHKILARKVISVGATAIAVSGLLLAASPPACATGPALMCETNGNYCVGDPHHDLPLYDPVKEMLAGRILYIQSLGGTSYLLEFHDDHSKCVAASDSGTSVVVHRCNGGAGVVWRAALGRDGVSCIFQSQEFDGKYLSGANNETQFKLKTKYAPGWYQQFFFSSRVISICG